MKGEDYRPRLSIVLDQETHDKLNELLGGWRIKNALFEKVTRDLIAVMEKLTPEQRRYLIVSVVEGHLQPEVYMKSIRKALENK
jgi:hypothetical protein